MPDLIPPDPAVSHPGERRTPGQDLAASAWRSAWHSVVVGIVAGGVWQGLSLLGWNGRDAITPGASAAAADVASVAADSTFAVLGLLGGGLVGARIRPWLSRRDVTAGWWMVLGGSGVAAGIAWVIGTAMGLVAAWLAVPTGSVARLTSMVTFLAWPLACAAVVLVLSVAAALRYPVHRDPVRGGQPSSTSRLVTLDRSSRSRRGSAG